MKRKNQIDWSGEVMDVILTICFFFVLILLGCIEGQIKWSTILIVIGCIVGIILLLLLIIALPYIWSRINRCKFDKRFNWLLKHKNELPLSDEEREMICEQNRKFMGINDDFYKEMKKYVRKHLSSK